MRLFRTVLMALMVAFAAAAAAASPADERTAARVFIEKMGQGRFDHLDEIYAPGFKAHAPDGSTYTLAEDNESGRAWREAIPDLQVRVERMVSAPGMVAVHWHAAGTNTKAAAGLPGAGRRMAIDGMTFFRFVDGRIAEEWGVIDMATMMQQLAAAPKPSP
jgi:steroid delta-isomerase-like uncharacterized protein